MKANLGGVEMVGSYVASLCFLLAMLYVLFLAPLVDPFLFRLGRKIFHKRFTRGEKITTEDFMRAGWVRKKRLVTAWEKVPNE